MLTRPGLRIQALAPYVDETVGLDLSENMVVEDNKWAEGQGFARTKAHALQLHLLAEPQPTDPDLSEFDVAAVSMALHHVAHPAGLLRSLSKSLRQGGVCVALERVFADETPELRADLPKVAKKVLQTINKHGFTEEICESISKTLARAKTLSM
ncbi:hypothetical protein PV04_00357 [Phialophora macrospora]|uniref:Methyltransferase type 12 domain-containing protein n=1 Tax=Phialophora macrospora TaxID=1851006 RepID=A0A0D2ECY2_9EURO|nr:hypothetical protein PV04_00357 [Phialophora macrospora]